MSRRTLLSSHTRATALRALVIAISAAALSAGTAAAATPSPLALPATDTLHAVECDTVSDTLPLLQVFSVDASTALMTPLGTGAPSSAGCSFDSTIDPTTNTAYIISANDTLWSFDPESAVSELVGAFRLASDATDVRQLVALAVDPFGEAFGIERNGQLHSLDLSTAELLPIGEAPASSPSVDSLAAHPVTGVLYAVTYGGDAALNTVDRDTGVLTLITSIAQDGIYSIGFDSAATMWVVNYDGNAGSPTLGSVDINDWAATFVTVGNLRLASNPTYNYYTEALFIASDNWPEPSDGEGGDGSTGQGGDGSPSELADTGAEDAMTAGVASAGVLLLASGATVMMLRRRARSAAA